MISLEYDYVDDIMVKMLALMNYAKLNGKEATFITDEDMGNTLLSYDNIKSIPKNDIEFFKERDIERFGN